MSKELKIILDELNYTIGKLNEKEKTKQLNHSQYWYREGLKTAKNIVEKVKDKDY